MATFRRWIVEVLWALSSTMAAPAQTANQDQVKAAYLYSFAKSAEWSQQALPGGDSPLVMCVFGGDGKFAEVLRSTLAGKNIREHPIFIRQVQAPSELKSCHLAFIRTPAHSSRITLMQLENASVLLVGEDREFLAEGGMINLTWEDQHLRSELNPAAIAHSNIRYTPQDSEQPGDARESTVLAKNSRSLKFSAHPTYPAIARQMNLKGNVNLEVIVNANGSVKSVRIVGGHPLLADAAARSVMQWKFESGGRETTEAVTVTFE